MKAPFVKISALVLTVLTFSGLLSIPAYAEKISEVEAQTLETSVYVGSERDDIDKESLVTALQSIRSDSDEGLQLVVVAPNNPQPSAQAFARRVQEKTGAEAVLLFEKTEQGNNLKAYTQKDSARDADTYPNSLSKHTTCALEKASEERSPADAANTFAKKLRGGCSGGLSSSFFLLFFLIASVIAAFWVVLVIENKRKRARMEVARKA